MLSVDDGLNILRMDPDADTEIIVEGLLQAIPSYIETTTGMSIEEQEDCTLCDTVSGFLLRLWFFPDGSDSEKLQRVVDNLLKTISAMKKRG